MKNYTKIIIPFFLICAIPLFSIEITPPKGWQEQFQKPLGIEKQYISISKEGKFSPNLNISRAKLPCCKEGDTSLDSLMIKVKTMQSRIFPLYKVKEKGKRNINKIKGAYIITTYAQGPLDLANFQFFYLHGEEFVNVVYTCLAENLEKLRPEIEKSVSTLKPGKKPEPKPKSKSAPKAKKESKPKKK